MKIGADRSTLAVHRDAQKKFEKDNGLCLVAKGLNPQHQNPAGMKITLPQAWSLVGKVEDQVNDDGTVNFYFDYEHHLLTVLENGPYTFKGWMVPLDRWNRMEFPTFLRYIPFWIRILNLLNVYRRKHIVESIGSKLKHVEKVLIIEATQFCQVVVLVKVLFNVDKAITLARKVQIVSLGRPVELEFRYDVLQKFCTSCGSLKHGFAVCPKALHIQPPVSLSMQLDLPIIFPN